MANAVYGISHGLPCRRMSAYADGVEPGNDNERGLMLWNIGKRLPLPCRGISVDAEGAVSAAS